MQQTHATYDQFMSPKGSKRPPSAKASVAAASSRSRYESLVMGLTALVAVGSLVLSTVVFFIQRADQREVQSAMARTGALQELTLDQSARLHVRGVSLRWGVFEDPKASISGISVPDAVGDMMERGFFVDNESADPVIFSDLLLKIEYVSDKEQFEFLGQTPVGRVAACTRVDVRPAMQSAMREVFKHWKPGDDIESVFQESYLVFTDTFGQRWSRSVMGQLKALNEDPRSEAMLKSKEFPISPLRRSKVPDCQDKLLD